MRTKKVPHPWGIALLLAGFAFLGAARWPAPERADAKVFYSKQEALRVAFANADEVREEHHFLTDAQLAGIQKLAKMKVDSLIVTFYVAYQEGEPIGYGYIDTHIVRTLPEALLFVVSPKGRLRSILLLAFYEPQEYKPPDRWLNQFAGRRTGENLRLRREIDTLSGATLTADAVTRSALRVMALWRVLYGED